ncbi:MAG: response regulator [Fimbriimonas sp.]|nr:response regulator [Fimbriimonas sp.]
MIDQKPLPHELVRHPLPPRLIHDLRSPLNCIIGYSEMLLEQSRAGAPLDFAPDLEKVRNAGKDMLGIIEDNFAEEGGSIAAMEYSPASRPPLVGETESQDAEGLLLVVDDDQDNREVLSRRLEKLGYTVAVAVDGRQALDMLACEPYELVLLDVMMPESDGYEVLRQLKANESLRHIPIIMVSAQNNMESVAKCIEMGAEDYLPKPFNPTLLKARVGASLAKKRGRDREVRLFDELQKNHKHLQELEALRDDFTHMIVHDLRPPLTAVIAAMRTLDVVGQVNPSQCEVMSIAINGADSLLSKINVLLDVEVQESGEMKLELSLISLPELIEASVAQFVPLAKAKKLSFVRVIAHELPWLQGDEDKLHRVIGNLIGNAIESTPSGGTVTLRVAVDQARRSVEFSISDTGNGGTAEAQQRTAENLGQVDLRPRGQQLRSSLGLTFCKLAVEAHGGHFGAENIRGEGSAFTFSIPLSVTA